VNLFPLFVSTLTLFYFRKELLALLLILLGGEIILLYNLLLIFFSLIGLKESIFPPSLLESIVLKFLVESFEDSLLLILYDGLLPSLMNSEFYTFYRFGDVFIDFILGLILKAFDFYGIL